MDVNGRVCVGVCVRVRTMPEIIPGHLAFIGGRAPINGGMIKVIDKVAFPKLDGRPQGGYRRRGESAEQYRPKIFRIPPLPPPRAAKKKTACLATYTTARCVCGIAARMARG